MGVIEVAVLKFIDLWVFSVKFIACEVMFNFIFPLPCHHRIVFKKKEQKLQMSDLSECVMIHFAVVYISWFTGWKN